MTTPDDSAILHLSQANPTGPGQDDVPALLRRVADTVSRLGDVTIQDITFHNEPDADGQEWPDMTVYSTRPTADGDA